MDKVDAQTISYPSPVSAIITPLNPIGSDVRRCRHSAETYDSQTIHNVATMKRETTSRCLQISDSTQVVLLSR
jgi:hypothetical protein